MQYARVFTFHVVPDELDALHKALDATAGRLARHAGFRGLTCLERVGQRHEIIVFSMWEGEGLEETEAEAERTRRKIAETSDLGVRTEDYRVLRHFPGRNTEEILTTSTS
jgi:heme-degrading monooxygenase HmoA